MGEKVIAIKIDIQSSDQKKKLESLQTKIDKLTASRKDLNRQIKDEGLSVEEASKKRANYNLQLKANRNALRDVEADILKQNGALRKNSGFVEGIKIALRELQAEEGKLVIQQDRLNKELKHANALYGKNSKQVTKIKNEYNNVSKSIKNVKNNINNVNKSIVNNNKTINNNVTNVSKLGVSFKKLGTSISGAFVGLFAVQKLFSIIGDGIKTIEDFEQQMANVRAVTGATATEFKLLTDSAKDLGRASQFTATEVGNLQQEYAKLGFTTAEILAASEATLQLATATGTDLAQAAEVAASTVNGFGLTAQDTQAIVDLMAESFSSTPLDINKFQESMKLVAPTAKSVGQSVQDTTAQLGLLAKSGISGSIAGTQLNRVFIELNKKGISLKDAMAQVSESTNKLGTATELVGDRGAKALQIFADQSEELGRLETAFADSTGEAKKMADIVGNTAVGAAKRFDSAWEGLLLTIGDGTEKGIAKAKGALADLLNDFTDINVEIKKLNELDGGSLSRGLGIINEADKRALEVLKEQEEFLKNNLQNRDNLQKALIANENQIKAIKKLSLEQLSAGNDVRDIVELEVKARQKSQLAIVEQLKSLKEKSIVEKATAEQAKLEADLAAKEGKKLSKAELDEIEKNNDKILASDKKLAEQVRKLKQEQLVLEIDDKRKAEFQKLSFSEQNAIREVELTVSTEQQKTDAILAIQSKFNTQRQVLAKKNAKDDAKTKKDESDKETKLKEDQDKKDEEKKEDDKQKAKDEKDALRQQQIEFAQETANLLTEISTNRVSREKDIAIANLDAQLQQGLISQEQFEDARLDIEKKAFEKQKNIDTAQALANGALAFTKTLASLGGVGSITPLGIASLALVAGQTAAQVGLIRSQSFAEGGYTGGGVGTPDATGFRQAGVVHEGEYVVPKNVLESNGGSRLVGALESMRNNRPQPYLSAGFANGGFSSGGSGLDLTDMENRISKAVVNSIGSIPVVNVATETTTQANRVNNIQSEATFG